MEDLEKFAREFNEWPAPEITSDLLVPAGFSLGTDYDGQWVFVNLPKELKITKSQWQSKRNELSGKPKEWVNDLARWRAQDKNGEWWEYEDEPNEREDHDKWTTNKNLQCVSEGEVIGDWRDTLEERVMECCCDESGPCKMHGEMNEIIKDTAVQDHELDGSEAEWDGIDYPPLRCEVEVHNDEGYTLLYGHDVIGRRGEVKSVYTSGIYDVVVVEIDGNGYCFKIGMIRPIKTPKEKHVQKMWDVVCEDPGHTFKQLEALYDAGCRMPDE